MTIAIKCLGVTAQGGAEFVAKRSWIDKLGTLKVEEVGIQADVLTTLYGDYDIRDVLTHAREVSEKYIPIPVRTLRPKAVFGLR